MTDNERKTAMPDNTTELPEGELEQAAGGWCQPLYDPDCFCPKCDSGDAYDVNVTKTIGSYTFHYNKKCKKCGTLFIV